MGRSNGFSSTIAWAIVRSNSRSGGDDEYVALRAGIRNAASSPSVLTENRRSPRMPIWNARNTPRDIGTPTHQAIRIGGQAQIQAGAAVAAADLIVIGVHVDADHHAAGRQSCR